MKMFHQLFIFLIVYGINWDDLMFEKNYKMLGCYSQSKLAQIIVTVELGKRLKG